MNGLIITKEDPYFDDFLFVCIPVNKNETGYKGCVNIFGGKMVGTDGRRLHVALLHEDCNFKDGVYNLVSKSKSQIILRAAQYDIPYPDIDDLIDREIEGNEIKINIGTSEINIAMYDIIKFLDTPINFSFLQDIAYLNEPAFAGVLIGKGCLKITMGRKIAFIMTLDNKGE